MSKIGKNSSTAISGILECSVKVIPNITRITYKQARGTRIGEKSEHLKKIFLKVVKEQKKKIIGFKKYVRITK